MFIVISPNPKTGSYQVLIQFSTSNELHLKIILVQETEIITY